MSNRSRAVIGTPDQVKEKLESLAREFDVDEIVICTFTEQAEDKFRSYELLASIFELEVITASSRQKQNRRLSSAAGPLPENF